MTPTGDGEALATFIPVARGDGGYPAAIIRGNDGKTIILWYMPDTPQLFGLGKPTITDRQKLFENVLGSLDQQPPVPVSPWALVFGVFLIAVFMVVRYKRNLA